MSRPRRERTGAAAIAGPPAGRGPRRGPFVVLVGAVFAATVAGLLTLNTLAAADELEQQSIVETNAVTAARVQALDVDLAARRAPAALARAAVALGLVPATSPAFLRIEPDGSVTLQGVPGAVTRPAIPITPPPAGSTALVPGAPRTGATSAATATPVRRPAATPTTTAPAVPATPVVVPTGPGTTPAPTPTVSLPGGAR